MIVCNKAGSGEFGFVWHYSNAWLKEGNKSGAINNDGFVTSLAIDHDLHNRVMIVDINY